MTARKHHYVPQCYLKGFSVQRKKARQVVVFDKALRRSFPASIADIAAQRDFNTVDVEGHPPDAIEQAMAKFETDLAPALERIIATGSLSDQNDRIYLMNLIGHVAIRNPRMREVWRDFQARVARSIMSIALATPERWASQMKKAQAAGYVSADADTDYERMKTFIEEGQYDITVPTERHIALEMTGLDAVLPHLINRKWVIVRAPPASGGFVTSDHPTCLIWSEPTRQPAGFGLKGTEVIFPLTSRLALIGAFELDDGHHDATEAFVAQINGLIIAHATRQVYARDQNFLYAPQRDGPPRKASRLTSEPTFKVELNAEE